MGASVATRDHGAIVAAVAMAVAVQVTRATSDSPENAGAGTQQASSSVPAVKVIDTSDFVASVGSVPATLLAFFGDVGIALSQPEARRGFIILCFACVFCIWLVVRFIWGMINRIAKAVVIDVMRDEEVSKLGCERFQDCILHTVGDPEYVDSHCKALWSDDSRRGFGWAISSPLMDENFVVRIAKFLREVVGIDFLIEAVKEQIIDFVADEEMHRALRQGANEALKPSWLRKRQTQWESESKESEPSTPVPPSRRPTLLGTNADQLPEPSVQKSRSISDAVGLW